MRLLPEKIGLRLAVAREDRSVGQRPVHAKAVERQGQAQRSRRQRDMRRRRRDLGRDGRPRTVVEPRAARPVGVALAERGHGPCALLTDLAPAQQRDPDEVVGKRDDPHRGAVAAIEHEPAGVGRGQAGAKDRFHVSRASPKRRSRIQLKCDSGIARSGAHRPTAYRPDDAPASAVETTSSLRDRDNSVRVPRLKPPPTVRHGARRRSARSAPPPR